MASALTTLSNGVTVTSAEDSIAAGDIVAIQHGSYGRTEGLVVGSHVDYAGRQIVEVQLAPTNEVYHAYYPTVQRIRRVVHHSVPRVAPVAKQRTVERYVYW